MADKRGERPAHPLAQSRPRQDGRPRQGRRPLPPGEQFFTPGATGLRRKIELRSAAPLVFLFQLPRWIAPAVLVALMLAAFAVSSFWGGLAVLPVIAFVSWLAYMSWPSLGTGGRIMRVALLTFLILVAADRFGAF
ncbi:hypothetical protein FHS43_003399 [Streptosporangium becharense]|uniref:Uncharacterized protein n=1 Tax=Streptosporangium becharense TaxID=1816182 RepID=A0A7W9MFM9_9ACTN|nr:DUF6703 family protein [Streptosporangium becharense]MBB2912119.1 hypothetical protein [Streptosporangium becharense]MBB5818666.1 hypothetical protein [Streptosporangium becharense]